MLSNLAKFKCGPQLFKALRYQTPMMAVFQQRTFTKTFYPQYNGMLLERGQKVLLRSKNLGRVDRGPRKVKIRRPRVKSRTVSQPPLRHDFINFKVMSGNEILLNMENAQYLRTSELINSLIELGKRKNQENHDWEVHPYTRLVFAETKKRMGQLKAKHLSQLAYALNRLNYNNLDMWNALSAHVIRIIHKFDAKSLANFLDVFVPPLEEALEDDVVYLDKEIERKQKSERCDNGFLQRIVTVLPIHIKDLSLEQLVRVLEVCSQRNLGNQRLYKEFLFFYVEKRMKGFNMDQYVRILRVLGDRKYTEDPIFWNDYVFPKIYMKPLNQRDAKNIWEALIALKLKCPDLNCDIPIDYIESLLKRFELMDGYEVLEQEVKDEIVQTGDLPEGVKTTIEYNYGLTGSLKAMEQAQDQLLSEQMKGETDSKITDPEFLRKKELREQRRIRREERQGREDVLYDSD